MYPGWFSDPDFARYQQYTIGEPADKHTYRMFLSLLCKLYNMKYEDIEVAKWQGSDGQIQLIADISRVSWAAFRPRASGPNDL